MSWVVAAAHAKRLASLTVMSRPHPKSFRRALEKPDGEQKNRSKHHLRVPRCETGKLLLADNARRLRDGLFAQGACWLRRWMSTCRRMGYSWRRNMFIAALSLVWR